MSREIIDKVVEMTFNAKQFQEDVSDSISTIEKLKQSLDLSVIGKSIDTVQMKFSALDTFVKRTVENLADNVYNSSKRMLKSLTVDNISAGWTKFADKTAAVQTIMSATAQTWEDSANQMERAKSLMERGIDEKSARSIAEYYQQIANGTISVSDAAKKLGMSASDFNAAADGLDKVVYSGKQMEYVDEQLQRLNWFTDETSYKFLDMVNNIGKFTSNNIPLEQSVTAMQGIATWAGISGANTNEAGRAMYNLSQAMSVGAVKLMDWKSIENANMATAEFKQTAIDTAVAMGTLTKNADGTFKTLKGNEVSVKNFNQALSDAWFSSEVLMKTLDKYGGFSVKLQEVSDATGLTAAELLNYITAFKKGSFDAQEALENVHSALDDTSMTAEELRGFIETLSGAEYELGERAFRAAQQAKTFQDVIDYVREAVSTGWSNTFQNIFGNYEEARDFWSQMAEELYGVFVEAGDERNALLSAWKEAGGRDDLVEAFWNIFHAVTGIINAIKGAFHDIFPKTTVEGLLNLTSRLKEFSQLLLVTDEETGELNSRGEKIRDTARGIFAVLGTLKDIVVALLKPIGNLFTGMGDGVLGATASFGNLLTKFHDTVRESGVLETITERVGKVYSVLNGFIGDTVQLFKGVSYWEGGGGIAGVFESIFDGLNNVIGLFFDLISAVTGKDLSNVRDKITDTIRGIRNKIVDGLGPLSDIFEKAKKAVGDGFQYLKDIFGKFDEIKVAAVQKLSDDTGKALSPLTKIFEGVKNIFSSVWEILKKVSPLIVNVVAGAVKLLGNIGKGIADVVRNADFSKILDFANAGSLAAIGIGIAKFIGNLKKGVSGSGGILDAIKGITSIIEGFPDMMDAWSKSKRSEILLNVAKAIGILAVSLLLLASVDPGALTTSIAAVTGLFAELMLSMKFLSGIDSKSLKSVSGLGRTFIGLAAGVLLLSMSVKTIASLDMKSLGRGLLGVTVLMADMVIAAKLLSSGDSKKMMKGAANAIMFAASICVLVSSVKAIAEMEPEKLKQGMLGVTVLIGEMVASAKILSTGENKKMMKGAANSLVFAAALRVLVMSVKALSGLTNVELGKGLGGLGIIIAEIVIASKVLSANNGGAMLKGATNALLFSAALLVLVQAVKSLGKLDIRTLATGLGSLAVLLAEVVIAANLMKGTAGGSGSLLLAAVALTVLAGALQLFARLTWDDLLIGLVGIGGALLVIGGAAALLTPVIPSMIAMAGALTLISLAALGFGAALVAIGAGLSIFAVTGEVALYALVKGLEILITAIPDLISALANSIAQSVDSMASLVISVGRAIIDAIRELIPDAVDTIIEVVMSVIDALSDNIQGIVEGLFDIVLGVLRGLTAKVPEIFSEILAMFKAIFGSIVEAMDGMDVAKVFKAIAFVAALDVLMGEIAILSVGAVAATALLPTIGRNLASFMSNLDPFFEKVRGVDRGAIEASESVAEMLLAFAKAGALEGVSNLLIGGRDLEEFGQELEAFAPHFVAYSNEIQGVKSSAVIASSNAAKAITAFADTIPHRGGLVALITGENSLSDFAEELKAFGKPFADYSNDMKRVDARAVTMSSIAATSVTTFVDTIPKQGGFVQLITGSNSLADFAEELKAFGKPFADYARQMEGIKPDVVGAASRAAETIAVFAEKIPKTGGLVQLITGENDLGEFANGLAAFIGPYVSFAQGVGKLTEKELNAVPVASAAAETIAAFAAIVPPSGGLVQLVTGSNDLGAFGTALASFGPNLRDYANSLSGVTFTKVKESGNSLLEIITVANSLPELGGVKQWLTGEKSLEEFGKQLASFGPNFAAYLEALSGVRRIGTLEESSQALKLIAEAASALPTDEGIVTLWAKQTTLSDFGLQLAQFGPNFAAYAATVSGIGTEDIEKSSGALKLIAEAADILPTNDGIVTIWSSKPTLSDFGKQLSKFADSFVEYATKVTGMPGDSLDSAAEAIFTLVNIANALPISGGVMSWIEGTYNLGDFGDTLEDFGNSFKAYSDRIAESNLDAVESSMGTVSGIFDIFPENYEGVDKILDLGSALVAFGNNIQEFTGMLYSMSQELPGYETIFSNVFLDIDSIVTKLTSTDVSSLSNYSNALSNVGENLYIHLSDGYSKHKPDLEAIAKEMASIIVDSVDSRVTDMAISGEGLSNSLKDGIKSVDLTTTFSSAMTQCVAVIRVAYPRFKEAGKYIITGFNAGISDNLYLAEQQGRSIADRTLKGINDRAMIKSPSRESYRSGSYMIIGLVNALRDGLSTVYSVGRDVSEQAVDGFNASLSRISEAVSSEIDLRPTISPVLDLSNVRKSARALNTMFSYNTAASISDEIANGSISSHNVSKIEYNQYNYSPKALSRLDIYRDTKRLVNTLKGR